MAPLTADGRRAAELRLRRQLLLMRSPASDPSTRLRAPGELDQVLVPVAGDGPRS
ncbi:MAG TPA: hypothetical protein VFB42_11595 [Gaiellaceae bacterium]|nr:hypothetical protein [Gaiellaceae bacterium]